MLPILKDMKIPSFEEIIANEAERRGVSEDVVRAEIDAAMTDLVDGLRAQGADVRVVRGRRLTRKDGVR